MGIEQEYIYIARQEVINRKESSLNCSEFFQKLNMNSIVALYFLSALLRTVLFINVCHNYFCLAGDMATMKRKFAWTF